MKITGKRLIQLGYEPADWFGKALEKINAVLERDYVGVLHDNYMRSVCDEFILAKKQSEDSKMELRPMRLASLNIRMSYDEDNEFEKANHLAIHKTLGELSRTPVVKSVSAMPDACPTGEIGTIPVGGVVMTDGTIHPGFHSADVCCSLLMTEYEGMSPNDLMDTAFKTTHFGAGGRRGNPYWKNVPEELKEKILNNPFLGRDALRKAKEGFATQGDGNHFLYVGKRRSTGNYCVVTHHGSRGLGAYLYKKGMAAAKTYTETVAKGILPQNSWLSLETQEGQDYWEALHIVKEWTMLNHRQIHRLASGGAEFVEAIFNEHNFVFKYKHNNNIYHAKGATPMDSNLFSVNPRKLLRLIPLNMSEPILIAKYNGKSNFAPHGAGRNMSRSAYKKMTAGLSPEEQLKQQTKELDIRFYSGKIDTSELPMAYKPAQRIREEIAQFGLADIVDAIDPYGCIMAGHFDKPWLK